MAGRSTYNLSETGNTSLTTTYARNGGLGIDRGTDSVTLDGVPVLAIVYDPVSGYAVEGTIWREPEQGYVIEYFDNSVIDPSGYGEGESLRGSLTVTTDANGFASFILPVPVDEAALRLTATSTGTDPDSWTSEFLAPPTFVLNLTGGGGGELDSWAPAGAAAAAPRAFAPVAGADVIDPAPPPPNTPRRAAVAPAARPVPFDTAEPVPTAPAFAPPGWPDADAEFAVWLDGPQPHEVGTLRTRRRTTVGAGMCLTRRRREGTFE